MGPDDRWTSARLTVDHGQPIELWSRGPSTGPLLVVLPGPGGLAGWADGLLPELTRRFRVVSWRRGRPAALSRAQAVAEVDAVVRHARSATWIGLAWSSSASTLLHAVSAVPGALAAIGLQPLLGTPPRPGPGHRRTRNLLLAAQRHPRAAGVALRAGAGLPIPRWWLRHLGPTSPTLRREDRIRLVRELDPATLAAATGEILSVLARPARSTPRPTIPTLLLSGRRDPLAPPAVCRYLRQAAGPVTLHEVPLASGLLPIEFAPYILLHIEAFLLEHGSWPHVMHPAAAPGIE